MGNLLLLVGFIFILSGILVNVVPQLKLPLLPGDVFVQKEGFTLYIPFTSSILLSIIITVVLRFLR